MSVFIITEIGSCHGGNLDSAKELCQAAAHAGADAVKGQYWSSAARMAERRHIEGPNPYEAYRMPSWWLPELKQTCDDLGIEFMCSVYLPEDIHTVNEYVHRHKVSSFESQDPYFLADVLAMGKETIVSLGMKGEKVGIGYTRHIKYLYCVSGYPTPDDQANISVVREWDGYSDHTTSILSGALAVACGATVIEKHLRLPKTSPGNPDYPHSFTPLDFMVYVDNIRAAEVLLGNGEPKIQPCEAENVRYRVVP